jgi:hypothetical protein
METGSAQPSALATHAYRISGATSIQEKSGWRVAVEVIGRGVLQIKNTFSSVAGVVQIGRFLGSE